ncbi:MAG: ECF transporter S component [Anaerolineae bacterium]|nr:ECF transporter S component [Anaerolineae bacterium]
MAANQSTILKPRSPNWIGALSLLLVSGIGIGAFALPFLIRLSSESGEAARTPESPLLTVLISAICLLLLFANLGPALSSKSVALIGVLVSINALLRYVDLSFLLPGEFTPIFILIMLVGYSFGAQLGFLMGALSLLASAFVTGGFGPWLPFQMFAAGWVGLFAAWMRRIAPPDRPYRAVLLLAIYGFVWGLLYGAIMNLYSWPFLTGSGWQAGLSVSETISRYVAFYLTTSLAPDLLRAFGNLILMLALGLPLLNLFRRFRQRFNFQIAPVIAASPAQE